MTIEKRMKEYYENIFRHKLIRRSYTIIRIDGKAFHTYTKNLTRPFDDTLINDINNTALSLCRCIQGAKFAYMQSDEISILLTDFDTLETAAWFDGNIQKMVSVSASMATAFFNKRRKEDNVALFDSRVFQITNEIEVANYFIWRQMDCVRNSIQSVAQSMFSHKELNGKSTEELQEMMFAKGTNWNNLAPGYKRGRIVHRSVGRRFEILEAPSFTKEKEFLKKVIPSPYEEIIIQAKIEENQYWINKQTIPNDIKFRNRQKELNDSMSK